MMKTVDFISLGCSKNLVDSEILMGLFEANGYQFYVKRIRTKQIRYYFKISVKRN